MKVIDVEKSLCRTNVTELMKVLQKQLDAFTYVKELLKDVASAPAQK